MGRRGGNALKTHDAGGIEEPPIQRIRNLNRVCKSQAKTVQNRRKTAINTMAITPTMVAMMAKWNKPAGVVGLGAGDGWIVRVAAGDRSDNRGQGRHGRLMTWGHRRLGGSQVAQ